MRTYVNTRGRMALPDGARMADTLSSFTAPLTQIAAAAASKNFSLAPETVRRFFQPKRKDQVATGALQRGVVEARRATVELNDHKWGGRCTWSANRVKLAENWLHLAAAEGITVAQYHLDECSKFNIWTAARARSPMGYLLVDGDGKARLSNWDHSFPLARAFFISLGGVVKCAANLSLGGGVAPKPGAVKCLRPSQMWGFIRSHRYHPGGARAVHSDLLRALQLDAEGRQAEVAVFVSDNGGAYNLDSPINHHCYGRVFRATQKASVGVLAYHAGGSCFNWPVEQQWTQPRQKLAGAELGKDCVEDPHHPFEGFETEEDALRFISDKAMQQIHSVLSSCKCGDSPWHIEAPTKDDLLDDWQDFVVVVLRSSSGCSSDQTIGNHQGSPGIIRNH